MSLTQYFDITEKKSYLSEFNVQFRKQARFHLSIKQRKLYFVFPVMNIFIN